jgi:hypothetical protein
LLAQFNQGSGELGAVPVEQAQPGNGLRRLRFDDEFDRSLRKIARQSPDI